MSPEMPVLCLSAVSIGVIHTLLGPDHYLPFVAMSKAGGWTARKTLGVTIACGLGHVASSVVIGIVGMVLGIAVMKLEAFETLRGDMAAWVLIGFGLAIVAWAARGMAGRQAVASAPASTPWLAFLVFVLGPCEPLIPMLMIPAARLDAAAVAIVVALFAVATVGTMSIVVTGMRLGLSGLQIRSSNDVSHVVAGLAIMACGVLVKVGL
jgi:nickel/cobalt transporter (NicO) family protein